MHIKLSKMKTCTLLGKYDEVRKVKICDRGTRPILTFELKMLYLFYFVLESKNKNRHNIETAVVHEKQFFAPIYILSLFYLNS